MLKSAVPNFYLKMHLTCTFLRNPSSLPRLSKTQCTFTIGTGNTQENILYDNLITVTCQTVTLRVSKVPLGCVRMWVATICKTNDYPKMLVWLLQCSVLKRSTQKHSGIITGHISATWSRQLLNKYHHQAFYFHCMKLRYISDSNRPLLSTCSDVWRLFSPRTTV